MQEAPGGPEVKHGGIGAGRRATGTQQARTVPGMAVHYCTQVGNYHYTVLCGAVHAVAPYCCTYISDLDSFSTPGVFCTYFYNHAHRLRLEKLL